MTSILLHGGYVYTPADPHASALLIRDGVVAWTGDDDAAEYLLEDVDHRVDVQGALIAPGFVDSWSSPHAVDDAARYGVVAHAVLDQPSARFRFEDGESVRELGPWLTPDVDPTVLGAAVAAGQQPTVLLDEPGDLSALLRLLDAVATEVGTPALRAARVRLLGLGELPGSAVEILHELGAAVIVGATQAEVPDLRALNRTGLPLALGTGHSEGDGPAADQSSINPWSWIRDLCTSPDSRSPLTVRAAFNAATRGGWRAHGRDDLGALMPGAPAYLAVFATNRELVVQTPDARVAAWSTDPRAGVPQLPDLSEDGALPVCLMTLNPSDVTYDAKGWLT